MEKQASEYEQEFTEDSFWSKVKDFAIIAGKEVIEKALTLYFVLQKENLPFWVKTTILSALGYFISPIDAIPDLTPVVGFSDDLGVLALAIASVAMYIDDEVKEKTQNKMEEWFN